MYELKYHEATFWRLIESKTASHTEPDPERGKKLKIVDILRWVYRIFEMFIIASLKLLIYRSKCSKYLHWRAQKYLLILFAFPCAVIIQFSFSLQFYFRLFRNVISTISGLWCCCSGATKLFGQCYGRACIARKCCHRKVPHPKLCNRFCLRLRMDIGR